MQNLSIDTYWIIKNLIVIFGGCAIIAGSHYAGRQMVNKKMQVLVSRLAEHNASTFLMHLTILGYAIPTTCAFSGFATFVLPIKFPNVFILCMILTLPSMYIGSIWEIYSMKKEYEEE